MVDAGSYVLDPSIGGISIDSLVYARFDYNSLECAAIKNIGLALLLSFYGGCSLVVIHQRDFSKTCAFG